MKQAALHTATDFGDIQAVQKGAEAFCCLQA